MSALVHEHGPLDLHHRFTLARQPARDRLAGPAAAAAFDAVEVVAGRIMLARRRFRRRRHPHDRDAALRSFELDQGMLVIVAVNDQLGAVPRQHGAQVRAVEQPLEMARRLADRRMVDQHHAKTTFAAAAVERLGEPADLLAAEASRRHKGRRRQRGRQSDQRQRAAPAHERKRRLGRIVAAHVVAPMQLRMLRGRAYIGIVIAGHQGDVVRRPERREPGARRRVFAGERDVDEVAGHRDVVGRLRLQVGHDAREHVGAMDQVALAPPVQKAGGALADELGQSRLRQRREMRVRQMREHEHGGVITADMRLHELPIKMPARNTSTPPTTT